MITNLEGANKYIVELENHIQLQRQALQQLIQGMEIMTLNARVLTKMTEPAPKQEDAA